MTCRATQNPHAMNFARRQFFKEAGAAVAAVTLGTRVLKAADPAPAGANSAATIDTRSETGFTLPKLPYEYDALEPTIDAETMRIHHTKHHQAYVNNLNAALQGQAQLLHQPLDKLLADLEKLPEDIRSRVRNNGGGHSNHTLFWNIMGPGKGGEPTGDLAKAIANDFGGFPNFREQFSQLAIQQFGSGWAWLSVGKDGKLVMESLPNQNSPLMQSKMPILGLDVWEHAYYLKYKNARPEYVKAWWNVVDWDAVAKNLAQARQAS